jgi:hypothetical protein
MFSSILLGYYIGWLKTQATFCSGIEYFIWFLNNLHSIHFLILKYRQRIATSAKWTRLSTKIIHAINRNLF